MEKTPRFTKKINKTKTQDTIINNGFFFFFISSYLSPSLYTNNTVSTIRLTTTTFEIFTPIDALSNTILQASVKHTLQPTYFTSAVSLRVDRHLSFGVFRGAFIHSRPYNSSLFFTGNEEILRDGFSFFLFV